MSLTEADIKKTSTMLAIYPPEAVRAHYAPWLLGEKLDDLHITLVYLGDTTPGEFQRAVSLMRRVMSDAKPLAMRSQGYGVFVQREDLVVPHIVMNAVGLGGVREAAREALDAAGLKQPCRYGFSPHMTLGYIHPSELPIGLWESGVEQQGWWCEEVWMVRGNTTRVKIPVNTTVELGRILRNRVNA